VILFHNQTLKNEHKTIKYIQKCTLIYITIYLINITIIFNIILVYSNILTFVFYIWSSIFDQNLLIFIPFYLYIIVGILLLEKSQAVGLNFIYFIHLFLVSYYLFVLIIIRSFI